MIWKTLEWAWRIFSVLFLLALLSACPAMCVGTIASEIGWASFLKAFGLTAAIVIIIVCATEYWDI